MLVSVVIPTYSMERYEPFTECVRSVLAQSYEPLQIVVVVDGNQAVCDRARQDFGDMDEVVIHCNEENLGVSSSRTVGAEVADGDVVAMIDDDATAEPDWIERLVQVYEETDAIAAGGDVKPDWQTTKPSWFPEEFYWLVGVVEPGFADDREEVRNVYGSNISYRREPFLEVGGYDPKTGRKGSKHLQAHEAPVGIRLLDEYGQGMVFVEDAVVHHKLFDYRGDFRWLVSRSFWQGYSKRVLDVLYPEAPDTKGTYLKRLLTHFVPKRFFGLIRKPSVAGLLQLMVLVVFTAAVGSGYVYALLTPNLLGKANR